MACRPYLGICFIGTWLTDPLNHYFGRRGTLFFCGIFSTLTVIGQAVSQTWPQLFVSPFHSFKTEHVLISPAGLPSTSWSRYGSQSFHHTRLCCRKCACKHPGWPSHVLATLGKIPPMHFLREHLLTHCPLDCLRYLSRNLCQFSSARSWYNCMAS